MGGIGNLEDRHRWGVCWGGGESLGRLNAKSTQFPHRSLGDTGALIHPRSPQFGDSAATEIWQIRTISQPGSGGSRQYNCKGGGERRLRRLSSFYHLFPLSPCPPPTSLCKSGCLQPLSDLIRNRAWPSRSHSVSSAGYAISAGGLSSAQLYIQEPL